MSLNVNRAVADPFYRYKMPKLALTAEGRGNGSRTVLGNLDRVAKALERPASYIVKHFGIELGAQATIDPEKRRYAINGCFDGNRLQALLDVFIRRFVLCPECDNPETYLRVKFNTVYSFCRACGHAFIIKQCFKLTAFIAKNPPPVDYSYGSKVASNNSARMDFAETTVYKDDDDWLEATEDEKSLSMRGSRLLQTAVKDKAERLDQLFAFFTAAKETGKVDGAAFVLESDRLGLRNKAPLLLVRVFFDEGILKDNQVETMRRLILRFTRNAANAQRSLLGGIEQLIVTHEFSLLPKSAHIIHRLYENDLVKEQTVLDWGRKPSSKFVSRDHSRKLLAICTPFLQWLRTAETEESEESEENVVFVRDHKRSKIKAQIEMRRALTAVIDEDGKEINVDDI